MNYLAHAYLSFKQPEILVGNMISDFVKGKKQFDFAAAIQKGIRLHRSIDTFTDTHHATKKAKAFLQPVVGLYAGAFIDVVYDHFLACDVNEFSNEKLLQFSSFVYATLENYQTILPEKFKHLLPFMKRDDWLYNYSNLNGVEKSFAGLAYRAKYLNESTAAFISFHENYAVLKKCYASFFPDVKDFAYSQLLHY